MALSSGAKKLASFSIFLLGLSPWAIVLGGYPMFYIDLAAFITKGAIGLSTVAFGFFCVISVLACLASYIIYSSSEKNKALVTVKQGQSVELFALELNPEADVGPVDDEKPLDKKMLRCYLRYLLFHSPLKTGSGSYSLPDGFSRVLWSSVKESKVSAYRPSSHLISAGDIAIRKKCGESENVNPNLTATFGKGGGHFKDLEVPLFEFDAGHSLSIGHGGFTVVMFCFGQSAAVEGGIRVVVKPEAHGYYHANPDATIVQQLTALSVHGVGALKTFGLRAAGLASPDYEGEKVKGFIPEFCRQLDELKNEAGFGRQMSESGEKTTASMLEEGKGSDGKAVKQQNWNTAWFYTNAKELLDELQKDIDEAAKLIQSVVLDRGLWVAEGEEDGWEGISLQKGPLQLNKISTAELEQLRGQSDLSEAQETAIMRYIHIDALTKLINAFSDSLAQERDEFTVRGKEDDTTIVTGNEISWGVDNMGTNHQKMRERLLYPLNYRKHLTAGLKTEVDRDSVMNHLEANKSLDSLERKFMTNGVPLASDEDGITVLYLDDVTFFPVLNNEFFMVDVTTKPGGDRNTLNTSQYLEATKNAICAMIDARIEIVQGALLEQSLLKKSDSRKVGLQPGKLLPLKEELKTFRHEVLMSYGAFLREHDEAGSSGSLEAHISWQLTLKNPIIKCLNDSIQNVVDSDSNDLCQSFVTSLHK